MPGPVSMYMGIPSPSPSRPLSRTSSTTKRTARTPQSCWCVLFLDADRRPKSDESPKLICKSVAMRFRSSLCARQATHRDHRRGQCTANSTLFWDHFSPCSLPCAAPHRVTFCILCPCVLDADWGLRSNVIAKFTTSGQEGSAPDQPDPVRP